MTLIVSNQTPGHITPGYRSSPKNDFNITELLAKNLVGDLLTPLNPNQPVTVVEDGNPIDDITIAAALQDTFGDVINGNAEATVKTLLGATMLHYNKQAPTKWLFATQAAVKHQLQFPTDQIIYTAQTDIIPTCKSFLAGQCDSDQLLVNFAFYTKSQTLGVWCLTESSFDDFKTYLAQQVTALQPMLSGDTFANLQSMQKLKLDSLTTSLILRKDQDDGNHEYSFPRILVWLLQRFLHGQQVTNTNTKPQMGLLPLDLQELYVPRTLTFVNVEAHARAKAMEIQDEWDLINNVLRQPLQILNKRQIAMLGGAQRNLAIMQKNLQNMIAGHKQAQKAINVKFSSKRPATTTFIKKVETVIKNMGDVASSLNTYTIQGRTFMRANRRDPNNINLMGCSAKTNYRPNIHLYVDTSGSISEPQYQDAVKVCIALAKKLDVDLYFNSFSTVISDATLLKVKGKSVKQVYAQVQRIPKVTGGTSFANVWDYITSSPARKKEFSLMITDFEDTAPSRHIEHPPNLYYTACSHISWSNITQAAQMFCDSAVHLDPKIRTKVLF